MVGGLMGVIFFCWGFVVFVFFFFCSKTCFASTCFLIVFRTLCVFRTLSASCGFFNRFLAVPSFQKASTGRFLQVSREPFSLLDTTYLSERDGFNFLWFLWFLILYRVSFFFFFLKKMLIFLLLYHKLFFHLEIETIVLYKRHFFKKKKK